MTKTMRTMIGASFCALALAGALAGCSAASANAAGGTQVDFAYIAERAQSAKVIDTRDFASYAGELHNDADRKGHFPGAISLPYENLLDRTGEPIEQVRLERIFNHAKLAPEDEIILYGAGDESVTKAASIFESCGYTNVAVCTEDFSAYAADESNEVEKSSLSCCAD